MSVECGLSLYTSWQAHSPALLAFGSDSLVELLSAAVVLVLFFPGASLNEQMATRLSGVLLYLLAVIVLATSVTAFLFDIRPESSPIGIGITAGALLIMPFLGWSKRGAARETGNGALAADAVQSATCAYLAAGTLVGLLINTLFHIGWIDNVTAVFVVPILVIEGRRAFRGQTCSC